MMLARNKVLILDDDTEICSVMTDFLNSNNYKAKGCTNVDEFVTSLAAFDPQFLLIDKNVNHSDTYPLISKIRLSEDKKDIPIILFTGSVDSDEQERAVNIGADDVIFKPFHFSQIRAKLKSLSRRSGVYVNECENLVYRNLTLNVTTEEVSRGGVPLDLTSSEAKILKALILSKGSVLSREQLDNKALTIRNNSPRTIDVHINSLRNKLGDLGSNIKTLRGRGYLLIA